MTTPAEELKKILESKDEQNIAVQFRNFLQIHVNSLPQPGEDTALDRVTWAASEFVQLSDKDEAILRRVTSRLLGETVESTASTVLRLRDLVGSGKDAAVRSWQNLLATMAWQQVIPAGALRGVGSRLVSLGTFQQDLSGANIQVNLGWMVDQDQFRILLNAKDNKGDALPDVELRVREQARGVVFSKKTNQDGSVVAPAVKVGPGSYQIEILVGEKTAQTPYFVL